MSERKGSLYHRCEVETVDGVDIGRLVLPANQIQTWVPDESYLAYLNNLNPSQTNSQELRRSIVFSLNQNTPNSHKLIGHQRPVSAYFTYNPKDRAVIIEWGKVDTSSGEAKLHDYLNQRLKPGNRVREGMSLTSGHIAEIKKGSDKYLAFLDALSADQLPNLNCSSPMGQVINSLISNGFIPLTAEAVVCFPIFKAAA